MIGGIIRGRGAGREPDQEVLPGGEEVRAIILMTTAPHQGGREMAQEITITIHEVMTLQIQLHLLTLDEIIQLIRYFHMPYQ